VETHIWLWKYTFLFMSGYGHDESAPTPCGVFVGILRNVHHVIANRSQPISCVFVAHSLVEYDVFVK